MYIHLPSPLPCYSISIRICCVIFLKHIDIERIHKQTKATIILLGKGNTFFEVNSFIFPFMFFLSYLWFGLHFNVFLPFPKMISASVASGHSIFGYILFPSFCFFSSPSHLPHTLHLVFSFLLAYHLRSTTYPTYYGLFPPPSTSSMLPFRCIFFSSKLLPLVHNFLIPIYSISFLIPCTFIYVSFFAFYFTLTSRIFLRR